LKQFTKRIKVTRKSVTEVTLISPAVDVINLKIVFVGRH